MIKLYLVLFYILGLSFCEETINSNEVDSNEDEFQEHISLVVHEDLINKFFRNMGKIQGEGTSSIVDYTWYLLDPRIEIEEAGASFHGKVRIKGSNFRVTRDLEGSVSITYDKDINILNIKIDKADVILDVDIFGSNVVLGTLDVGKYFT